jgi:hypothetical protein
MKRRRKKGIVRLRPTLTDKEITEWATENDVFARLDAGVSEIVEDHADLDRTLEEAVYQSNTAQLNMRISPGMKAVLGRLARERTTDATTLARIWLAERLRQEIKGPSQRVRAGRTRNRLHQGEK